MPGSVVLLGGEPRDRATSDGFLLQVAARLVDALGPVLYVTAEESARQVKMGPTGWESRSPCVDGASILPAETSSSTRILDAAAGRSGTRSSSTRSRRSRPRPPRDARLGLAGPRVTRPARLSVRRPTGVAGFPRRARHRKDGTLAGPKTLEHLVDAVLSFEGERFQAHRVLRALKNRFGPVHELGVFEMTGTGLVEVTNPSALYLGGQTGAEPGSAILAAVEGTRPLLLEVQALTVPVKYGTPRRTAIGFDGTRLALLLAVLERHGGLALSGHDVFLNIAGAPRAKSRRPTSPSSPPWPGACGDGAARRGLSPSARWGCSGGPRRDRRRRSG